MSPVVIKGLIGAGFLSVGGVGIWQTIELFTPRNIRQRLELDGESFYSFVEGEAAEGWKKLAKTYKTSGGSELSNVSITNSEPDESDAKKLQTECKKLAEQKLEGDYQSNLEKVKKWCTVKVESNDAGSGAGTPAA